MELTIFTSNGCEDSIAIKKHFYRKGIAFREINIDEPYIEQDSDIEEQENIDSEDGFVPENPRETLMNINGDLTTPTILWGNDIIKGLVWNEVEGIITAYEAGLLDLSTG